MRGWRERNRLWIGLYIVDLAITLMVWGGFYRESFGADTLFRRMMPMSDIGGAMDQQRYLSYLFAKILYDHGIMVTDHYLLFLFFFIFTISVDMWLLQRLFYPLLKEKIEGDWLFLTGYIACTALIFTNVLFSENFMFPEYHVNYAFAYLLGTLSVCALAGKKWVSGMLFVAAACLFYQVAIVYTAILITSWLVIENGFTFNRSFVGRVFWCNTSILLVGLADYVSNGWLKALGLLEKGAGGKVISEEYSETVKYLLEQTFLLLENSLRLLPSLWIPLFLTVESLILLVISLRERQVRNRWITLLLYLVTETCWFYLFPFLAGQESMTPRVSFVFYAIQAMIVLLAMITSESKRRRYVLTCSVGIYLCLQGFFCQSIIQNRYLTNRLDIIYAQGVLREMEKYEAATGIKVKKVAIHNDADAPNSYEEVKYKRDQVNERVLSVSPFTLLEYVNGDGMQLEHVEMDEDVYNQLFMGKNWDSFFPEEQLVFIDDTMYWAIF